MYVRLNEKLGRDSLEEIAAGLPNKTLEEVEEYSKVFWKNWKKIENG